MQPLVLKAIITFAEERSAASATNSPVPNIDRGIAMALGLSLLVVTRSLCTHQVGMGNSTNKLNITDIFRHAVLLAVDVDRCLGPRCSHCIHI